MNLQNATLAFDLDGTLVDTAPDLIGMLNLMLDEAGLPSVPLSAARHLVGGGARRMLEHGFQEAGRVLQPAEAPALLERFVEIYRARIADESRVFDGVEATLDQLAAAGARLCVCTNKRTDLSVDLLRALGLADRFAAIVGADAVTRRKPDAAHLLETVSTAGGDPSHAVMIGDSDTDFHTARAAGAPVILVPFGYCEVRVEDLGADAVIEHFADLPAALAAL